MSEELITRREAAELAGVHINTVRLWETTGRVSVTKAENGVVMIPRAEVEAIIESRRSGAQSEGERAAGLEAENRELRRELEALTDRYERLLDEVLHIAGDRERKGSQ